MKSMTLLIFLSISTQTTQASTRSVDLFAAIETGDHKAVKKLLKTDINVNGFNNEGKTALDVAVECKNFKIARNLINYGGKVTTIENMKMIKKMYGKRALKFFFIGLGVVYLFAGLLLLPSILCPALSFGFCFMGGPDLMLALPAFVLGSTACIIASAVSGVQASRSCLMSKEL